MGTCMLSTWIKGITGHNNLAYFQSKLNAEIDPIRNAKVDHIFRLSTKLFCHQMEMENWVQGC